MSDLAALVLRPRRAKPFFMRHPWVFSGAVDRLEGCASKGDFVRVVDETGQFIATALFNPESQIVARLLSWNPDEAIDEAFWRRRLEDARRLREETLRLPQRTNAYRLCHGESDGLPGLVVDRFGDYLVCQFHTAGLLMRRPMIVRILEEMFHPRGVWDASDADMLAKEGFGPSDGLIRGEAPPETLELRDGPVRFVAGLASGQKTGWYLDQRDNRAAAARYAEGRRVLDVFCYGGGFALAAAVEGKAREVIGVDRSERAIDLAARNAQLNGLANTTFRLADADEEMWKLRQEGEVFDMVVLDPPRFARSQAGVSKALEGYQKVNFLALRLLAPGGVLVTCSCSQHVSPDDLLMAVNKAATQAGRVVQILEARGQAPDHPVIASCPETGYLKCLICRAI
ncbi:MAG TPA: class I SAM-dependent rRNA methyltransferase [Candidatus Brocadiia bacterium]|nr:class I SAM-dependent rRNA methyltransferase [Candidatus Brocadiia bacterium]